MMSESRFATQCANAGFLLILLSGFSVAGVGDGPRATQLAPVGTRTLNVMPIHQNTSFNVDGSPAEPAARIKADLVAVQLTRVDEVAGRAAGFFALVPGGELDGKLLGTSKQSSNSGVADPVLGMVIGVVGSPALSPQAFSSYKPDFTLGFQSKLTLPLGSYDADETFNLGANRWAFQVALPVAWYFGEGLMPGQLTSLELTPGVTWYGDNDDLTDAEKLEQRPLYSLEMNFTHDFTRRFWGSVDALYVIGGATVTDGVRAGNETEKFALGGTLGMYLPRGFGVQLNYGKTLQVDTDGYHDHLIRIKLTKVF